jgi:mannose-6-phosphate isomerase class I
MMGKDKVKKRIAEIQQLLLIRTLWSREQSVMALKEVIKAPDRKSDVVAAVRELNTMHGFHEAQKIEHSGTITSIERRIVDVTMPQSHRP